MRTVHFYRWKPEVSITAYCDKYAVSENNILYFISLSGAESAVRGIISAIQMDESITIRSDEEDIHCRKGLAAMKSATSKIAYENMTHGLCLDVSFWEMNESREILLLQNDPETLYSTLHQHFSITAIPEWKAWIYHKLQPYIARLISYGMDAFLLKITEKELDEIISTGFKRKEIRFTKACIPDDSPMKPLDGVESYLQLFGSELAKKIHTLFEPSYIPEKQAWSERIHSLRRKPFQAQGDAIMGAVETLRKERAINIIGEMGVGKTLIGAAIPYISSKKPCRTLIVCPGHLVHKWAEEIQSTIPHSEAFIIRKYTDLIPLRAIRKTRPSRYEFYIISRDKAKLAYFWKPAIIVKNGVCSCPQCGKAFQDKEGWNLPLSYFSQSKRYCSHCHSPLWEADNTRIRRFAPAEFIKKYLKGFFQYLEADEVHELKGSDTAQGNVLGMLASCTDKVITLTGTFLSGYADSIFFILYRIMPRKMKQEGFLWTDTQKWLQSFGILERMTKTMREAQDNSASRGSKKRESIRRKPGVSPLVYSKFLLGNTVFLQLDDISDNLPALTENVVGIKMSRELELAYQKIESCIGERVRKEMACTGHSSLLGTYMMSLLSYPDQPFHFGPILHPSAKKELPEEYFFLDEKEKFLMENTEIIDLKDILVIPHDLPEETIYPKERLLLEIVEKEIKEHRRCLIFATFSGIRDVTARIESLLKNENFRAITLKSTVPPETRISWVNEKVKQGYEIIIANPELVKTGLDLLDFPSIVFFETGYNTFTLRQSSRRSWRLGQKQDVKIFYLYYTNTLQEQCLKLMGAKLEAAIGIEGKFSEEGLVAMSSGDDLMNALAKSIAGNIENTDSVENIWKRMAQKAPNKNTSFQEESSFILPEPIPQNKLIMVEIIRHHGKRKIIERVEGNEQEIKKIMQETQQTAQMLLF